jgi:hypothetical protein
MKRIVLTTLTLAAATAAPFALPAAETPDNPNRLSLGARLGFNFKADFRNSAPVNSGPLTPGATHVYDDGYVLPDSSGNAGGLTWNWGYENASQVVGNTLQFSAIELATPGAANSSVTGDPQYGLELIYQRVLGSLGSDSSLHWGFEAALGYTKIDLSDSRSTTGPVTVNTDTYQLNGVIPPGAGYNGTFAGPGPLLGDTPTRTTLAGTGTLSSHHELTGESFGIRLGPFLEWSLTSKLSLVGSLGLALAPTSVDYDFSETSSVAGGGTATSAGSASESELLYGYYVSALLRYDFNEQWGIYGGAQFQSLTDLEVTSGGHTAELDSGATVYATIGVSWKF